jgi:hypothetical protein
MFVQDNLGYIHEISDAYLQAAPDQPVFDGLGNPVGQLGDFFDFLKPIGQAITAPIQAIGQAAGSLLPAVGNLVTAPLQMATAPLQAVGGLVSSLLPHPAAPPVPQMVAPSPMSAPVVAAPSPPQAPWLPPPMPVFHRTPFPQGWVHSNLPYTGHGPQRLYMRCAVWPGPAGLVPGPQMPTGPWPAGGPAAALPGVPGGGYRYHRHGRRRR